MQWKATVLATALTVHAGPGLADESGVYLGIKAGGYEVEQGDIDSNEFAFGAYAGYRYNANLAFELEYSRLYADDFLGGDFDGYLTVLSVVPTLPLDDNWDLYAKLGWAWLDFTIDGGFSPRPGAEDEDDDFFWGLGASWSGENWQVRGEFQADTDTDLMLYTLGIGYRF